MSPARQGCFISLLGWRDAGTYLSWLRSVQSRLHSRTSTFEARYQRHASTLAAVPAHEGLCEPLSWAMAQAIAAAGSAGLVLRRTDRTYSDATIAKGSASTRQCAIGVAMMLASRVGKTIMLRRVQYGCGVLRIAGVRATRRVCDGAYFHCRG